MLTHIWKAHNLQLICKTHNNVWMGNEVTTNCKSWGYKVNSKGKNNQNTRKNANEGVFDQNHTNYHVTE